MGKKATKAADSIYCQARYEACENNSDFGSREKASEIIGIDRTRLARIELGKINPYPEEVLAMAEAYNCPELCNYYCAKECAIGKTTVNEVSIDDFDRLALKVLGSLKDIDDIRASLIAISEDGIIDETEWDEFNSILDSLDKISTNAAALQLWAKKNIKMLHKKKE
ncbi:MAG: helix-turn-helix transcriptional regulator [Lachnospiraceae bacterium]